MQGNSLIESFMGMDLSKLTYEKSTRKIREKYHYSMMRKIVCKKQSRICYHHTTLVVTMTGK